MVAPAVPNEQARLRFFIACTHTERELESTVRLLAATLRRLDADGGAQEADEAPAGARSTVSA